jgi:hypothetical protein
MMRRFWHAWLAWRTARMVMRRVDWEDDDSKALSQFLTSSAGRKLGVMMRDLILNASMRAMDVRGENLPWEAGRVVGMRDLAAFVDALLVSKDAVKPTTGDDRPTDDLNWLHGHNDDAGRTG